MGGPVQHYTKTFLLVCVIQKHRVTYAKKEIFVPMLDVINDKLLRLCRMHRSVTHQNGGYNTEFIIVWYNFVNSGLWPPLIDL